MTKFIAILSGKGGVGKTTAAINLAYSLSLLNSESIVVDADFATPNVSLHLGHVAKNNFHDAIEGKVHILDVVHKHSSGLKFIPADLSFERDANYSIEQIEHVLLDLESSAEKVILDTSAGLNDDSRKIVSLADETLIITNPDLSSVIDARKAIRLAYESGSRVLGFVLNNYRGDHLDLSIKNVEHLLDQPLIGVIPNDESVREALLLKHPVCYSHPNSLVSKSFLSVADKVRKMF